MPKSPNCFQKALRGPHVPSNRQGVGQQAGRTHKTLGGLRGRTSENHLLRGRIHHPSMQNTQMGKRGAPMAATSVIKRGNWLREAVAQLRAKPRNDAPWLRGRLSPSETWQAVLGRGPDPEALAFNRLTYSMWGCTSL